MGEVLSIGRMPGILFGLTKGDGLQTHPDATFCAPPIIVPTGIISGSGNWKRKRLCCANGSEFGKRDGIKSRPYGQVSIDALLKGREFCDLQIKI